MINVTGKKFLTIPQLNKSTAFSQEERLELGLIGKLPVQVETLEQQVQRAYLQYSSYQTLLHKRIYLNDLHDKNQVLFYKLVSLYLTEMMPVIYTPVVGTAVQQFHREFRQPRGLYIAYPDREYIDQILDNRTHPHVDLIVMTDGEGVLGIGDQGIGAIDIPIAKLMVYTLCGGLNPSRTLPIQLDVGTNNQALLDDPLYLGWRHPRLQGQEYDDFIDQVVQAIKRKFSPIFLHWEDFGKDNARRNLVRFQDQLCTFNDDIQGTGAVTLAAILAAVQANQSTLSEQRVVIYGAGTAGTGIADQICEAMIREGLTPEEARKRFWLLDRNGLVLQGMPRVMPAQAPYARPVAEVQNWSSTDLLQTVINAAPTILIGSSAKAGGFTQEIVEAMVQEISLRPIILPLSNPTEYAEATPVDLLKWTQGRALIATGSPFGDVDGIRIAQCNNALVFPGIGMGVLAVQASRFTEGMLWAASETLSECAPIRKDPAGALLPTLSDAKVNARKIAIAVAKQACAEGLAQVPNAADQVEALVDRMIWEPEYAPLGKPEIMRTGNKG